jgi:hypothetical protein
MSDWIGIAFIGLLILAGLFGLWKISQPYEVSVEEFEKRAAEQPSLLSAGFTGLQKMLDPAAKKAIEAQEDFKQGRFDSEQAKGDGDEAGNGEGSGQEAEGSEQKAEGREAEGRKQKEI